MTPKFEILRGQVEEFHVRSWDDFEKELSCIKGRGLWCFRGQSNAGWGLAHSLERLVGEDRRVEIEQVERVLLDRFQRQAHHYLAETPDKDKAIEWMALMQHWGAPTRLLDFTLSPYVALYFAVSDPDANAGKPGAVYCIQHTTLEGAALDSLDGHEIMDVLPAFGTKDTSPIKLRDLFDAAFKKRKSLDLVAPLQPLMLNERVAVQQGIFLCPFNLDRGFESTLIDMAGLVPGDFSWFSEPATDKLNPKLIRRLVVDQKSRPELLWRLQRMNITAASLFPGLPGFARSLKEAYQALGPEPLDRNHQLAAIRDFGWAV